MKKPQVFGKYLLLERLNTGGMAEVFIAKSFGVEGFERILAIKKILPTMAEDEEFINMFIDEARISVNLNHANIVRIHELGKYDYTFYIAMEYVSGKDLRALLEVYRRRREIMPTAQAVFVTSKLAEGLDYAHRRKDMRGQPMGIIHRDITPQNVLLSFDGEVKIIDFGIAKAANRSQRTQAGILKGKFGYMSPEQVLGLPLDGRSDIFALGVILYETLTGERLFVGASDFSTLERIRSQPVPPPRQYNPGIPAGLEKVMLKALARDAAERYSTGAEFQEDLMRFLLAGDVLYSARHLATCMHEAFAEDIQREAERMARFADISRPDQIEDSGLVGSLHDAPDELGAVRTGYERRQGERRRASRREADVEETSSGETTSSDGPREETQIVAVDSMGQPVEITEVKPAPEAPPPTPDRTSDEGAAGGAARGKVVIGQKPVLEGATVVGPAPEQEHTRILAKPERPVSAEGLEGVDIDEIDAESARKPGPPVPTPPPSPRRSTPVVSPPPSLPATPEGPPVLRPRPAAPPPTPVPVLTAARPRPSLASRLNSIQVRVAAAVLVLLLLVGTVAGTVLRYRSRSMKGNVLVTAVPEKLVVLTLAGQHIRNGEITQLSPGDYELEVSAPGYVTHRERVHVQASRTASRIEVVLPRTASAPDPGPGLAPLKPDAGVQGEQAQAPARKAGG